MFPSEIVSDILSRLPVKPLLRFRCVSKQWCTLIGSQEFIKLHLNRSIKTSSNINIMLGYLGVYSINVDSLDVAQRLNPPLSCSEFSNSCNGLVLVLSKNPCIWNPATRKFKELTACPVEYPPGENVSSAFETYGFAYDSETDDYLVARVVEFKKRYDFSWIRSETRVFSLNSNSWKKMPDFPYQLPYKRVWGAHLNGVLHTAIEKVSLGNSTIMAYDTRNGSHYVVPKPKFGVRDAADFTVEVLRGCICLLLPLRQHRMDIWVMKEYGKKESWTKLLTVAPPLVEPYVTLVPLVYSRDGTKVLLNHDDKAFIWYDLRKKKVTKVSLNGLPHMFYTEVYTESLVSADGFGDKDGLKKQNNGGEDGLKKQSKGKTFKGKRDDFLSKGFKLAL